MNNLTFSLSRSSNQINNEGIKWQFSRSLSSFVLSNSSGNSFILHWFLTCKYYILSNNCNIFSKYCLQKRVKHAADTTTLPVIFLLIVFRYSHPLVNPAKIIAQNMVSPFCITCTNHSLQIILLLATAPVPPNQLVKVWTTISLTRLVSWTTTSSIFVQSIMWRNQPPCTLITPILVSCFCYSSQKWQITFEFLLRL